VLPAWTFLIATHAIAAALSLVLGPFQIIRRPKGDPVHRLVGRCWAVLMLYVAAGSFLFGGYDTAIAIFLRVLAAWTLCSVTLGIVMARRGNVRRHRGFMIGTYVGLVAAFVGVVAVHTRRVPAWFVVHPVWMSLVTVAIIAVASLFLAGVEATTGRRQHVLAGSR
jgi:uncharacterized membrane protein